MIERARSEDRVIATGDLDYPRLMALARAARPGVILVRGGRASTAEIRGRLARAPETIPADELPASMVVIEPWRSRRRRLPIQ